MKKQILLILLVIIFGVSLFTGGYFLGMSMNLQEFTEQLEKLQLDFQQRPGLLLNTVSLNNQDYFELWIPAGFPDKTGYGANFVLLRRLIPFSFDREESLKLAITELLRGPNEEEIASGAYSLIRGGTLKSATIDERGTAILDFSQEFDPEGGSFVIFITTKAVEEVARQFIDIKKVKILIEGVEDALQP